MFSRLLFRRLCVVAGFVALPAWALAHPGHDGHELTWDFTGGATHPLYGLDHLLALVAVGVWSARLGGRARWLVPAAFLGALGLGAALAPTGAAWPMLEQGLAASVLAVGLAVAAARGLPVAVGAAAAVGFGLLHGFAHGAEMPTTANGVLYGLGLGLTSAALLAGGVALGATLQRSPTWLRPAAGLAVAAVGAVLFFR